LGNISWPGGSPDEASFSWPWVIWLGIFTFMIGRISRAERAMITAQIANAFRFVTLFHHSAKPENKKSRTLKKEPCLKSMKHQLQQLMPNANE
jgi:hypothetical protein